MLPPSPLLIQAQIPAYPNVVASGSYLTSGYGPPARIIAVHNPSDCESIIYVLDQARQ